MLHKGAAQYLLHAGVEKTKCIMFLITKFFFRNIFFFDNNVQNITDPVLSR